MSGASKSPKTTDGWPSDGGPLDFEEISRPVIHAIRFAYDMHRRDRRRNIPWRGPDIGEKDRACCLPASERLKAASLAYAEEDQGRDTLDEIVGLAIQLGIEQGRRIAKSDESRLLDEIHGAVFTLSVGWNDHTHLHTQAGVLTNPAECLRKAMKVLEDELSRVQRCPRERALRAGGAA